MFGAHTRQQSQGSVDDMRNNHPVSWNGVHVTHNGTIRSDDLIKRDYSKPGRSIAEVDSVVIAMLLSDVGDPTDSQQIGEQLSELDGSFAFHAVWKAYPGLSLLCRGSNSPLIMAWHPNGCIAYGSEVESVWAVIRRMGLKPHDEQWDWGALDNYKFMVFDNGKPVTWGSIPYTRASGNKWGQSADYSVSRVLPREKGRGSKLVYTSNIMTDFAVKAGPKGRDISLLGDGVTKLIYTSKKGFTSDKEEFPRKNDYDTFSVISEADHVVSYEDRYHAFFGNVEIILAKSGRTIIDVYNHDKFKNNDRWLVEQHEPKEPEPIVIKDTELPFDEFFTKKTGYIPMVPDDFPEYAYTKKVTQTPLTMGKTSGIIGNHISNGSEDNIAYQYIPPLELLDWSNVWERTLQHDVVNLYFMTEERCTKHGNQAFEQHDMPYGCDAVMYAAAYTLSCVMSVELISTMLKCTMLFVSKNKEMCIDDDHEFTASRAKTVRHGTGYFEIDIEEECIKCASTRELKKLPVWLTELMDEGEVIKYAYAY